LVLTALGCGAFANPPEIVAGIFGEVLKQFKGCFKEVIFAIIDDRNAFRSHNPEGNFSVFRNELDGKDFAMAKTEVCSGGYDCKPFEEVGPNWVVGSNMSAVEEVGPSWSAVEEGGPSWSAVEEVESGWSAFSKKVELCDSQKQLLTKLLAFATPCLKPILPPPSHSASKNVPTSSRAVFPPKVPLPQSN
jgi:hypothetical protein